MEKTVFELVRCHFLRIQNFNTITLKCHESLLECMRFQYIDWFSIKVVFYHISPTPPPPKKTFFCCMLSKGTLGPRKYCWCLLLSYILLLFAEADQETLLDLDKTTQSTQRTKENTRKAPHCKTCKKPMRGHSKATCTAL